MRLYTCFYNSNVIQVSADSTYSAQKLAAETLKVKPKLQYMIAVMLADVTHDGAEL